MTDLPAEDAIDRDLLIGELEASRFSETVLREDTWNPLDWVYLAGEGLFTLLAREFAPLADRLTSTAGRLEGLPAVFEAARATLVGSADRPVGRFQTETALRQLAGVEVLIADAVSAAEAASADPAVAALRPRLDAAAATARGRRGRLRDPPARRRPARQRRRGPSRSGALRREDAPHHALRDAHARADHGRGRARVRGRSGPRWSAWRASSGRSGGPTRRRRRTRATLVRGVLDAIAAEHPEAADLLDFCRAENARIEAFCMERDLIGLADDPLEIQWTPVFLRSFGGAMLSSPGPLDRGQKAFFAITPMPDDWSEEQRESNLREDNDRMLRLLTIHEAVPGPLPPGRLREPLPVDRPGDLRQRPVRRGLGGLRDPGDDGRRLRRGRPGAAAGPLEVLPALGHQRDHRREDPLARG